MQYFQMLPLFYRCEQTQINHDIYQKFPANLDQEAWLERYAHRDNEAYFIIENSRRESLGTVRLYNSVGKSFCWGSWIIKDGAPEISGNRICSYGVCICT